MNWNRNVVPFIPALAFNDDWSEYSINDLKKLSIGRNMLQIELLDNSMFDQFQKHDIITLELTHDDHPDEGDGLLLMSDDSLLFRHYVIDGNQIVISPLWPDFCEPETFDNDAVKIIAIAVSTMR